MNGSLNSAVQALLDTKVKGKLTIGSQKIFATDLVESMFILNGYAPFWSKSTIAELRTVANTIEGDGLQTEDYWFAEIDEYLNKGKLEELDAVDQVRLNFLLTETFARIVYNLKFGKVDPVSLDRDINFVEQVEDRPIAPVLLKYILTNTITSGVNQVRPDHLAYSNMRQKLQVFKRYQQQGGWSFVSTGKALKPGENDLRVGEIKKRLAVTGQYQGQVNGSDEYDEQLVAAVKQFQRNHGLEADGIIGTKTLTAMNIPVEARIDQIRVGLERLRWYLHEARGDYIVVNIAGFSLYWVRDKEVIWKDRVQVGSAYTKTPVFKDMIRFLVLNPDWTIPPGILKRTILPGLQKDPGYLDKKGYLLLDRNGVAIDPHSINWNQRKSIPYIVRQPPGPNNALGQIKIMFPNPHYVYLHDTNHRELFERTSRTFSSGCIRVQHPFELAERLLNGQKGWSRERLEQVRLTGRTTTVRLEKPIKVIIGYFTTTLQDGRVVFSEDVYNRDQAVLDGLNGPFQLRQQDR